MSESSSPPQVLHIPAVRFPGGDPAYPPLSISGLAAHIAGRTHPVGLWPVSFRGGGDDEMKALLDARWRLVLPADIQAGPAERDLLAALEPLCARRRALPPLRYEPLQAEDPAEAAALWAERHTVEIDETAWFLVVGDPADIPFAVTRHLGRNKLAGRLSFSSAEAYAAYAEKVVRAETLAEATRQATSRPSRPMVAFAPDLDEAVRLSRSLLVEPIVDQLAADRPTLPVERLFGNRALHRPLLEALGAGEALPSLLLAACHGLEQSDPDDPDQGALCDQVLEPLRAGTLEAHPGALLPAGIAVLWACNGGGTPRDRAWTRLRPELRGTAPPCDRAAHLPSILLSRSDGPLAVVAHEDIILPEGLMDLSGNLPESISSPGVRPLLLLIDALLRGVPVGMAMRRIRRGYDEAESRFLRSLRRHRGLTEKPTPADEARLVTDWIRWLDLEGWVVLGDPRVCLEAVSGQIELVDTFRG